MNQGHETSADSGDSFGVWRALLQIARPYRFQFAVVAALALVGTVADLVGPLIYREAVNDIAGLFVEGGDIALQRKAQNGSAAAEPGGAEDSAAPAAGDSTPGSRPPPKAKPHRHGRVAPRTANQTLRTLLWAAALLFALNVAAHAFQLWADHRTTVLASRIERDVVVNTFSHVLRLPLAFFSRRTSGALSKQIDQLDQVSPIITAFAHQIAPELIRLVFIFLIMVDQNWRLTLLTLVTLPPYILVVRRSALRLESGLDRYYEMWEGITSRIQAALGAIKTVKLSGAEVRESGRLGVEASSAFALYVERNRRANRYRLWQTSLTYLSEAIALAYGGYLVLDHQLTPGDVVMFVAYLDKLYAPIDELSGLTVSLQEHLASLRRALRLQATGGAERGGERLAAGSGRVEFREVGFSYVPGRLALDHVSFSLEPGTVTALVGPSGAGKTTLTDLLLKLFEPDHGEILIDGQKLSAVDASSVRAAIGVISADGAIFPGTIADNIRYKRPEASDAELQTAAVAAGLAGTLARLPEGLATEIGERGVGLSIGERQRVQIARVLLGRPRVLVLDEATANLDYATENDIRGALLRAEGRPTTLVIAHRFSMVKDADQVIVLQEGRLAEQGTVEALTGAGGWFARFATGAAERPAAVANTGTAEAEDESNDTDDTGDDDDDGATGAADAGKP